MSPSSTLDSSHEILWNAVLTLVQSIPMGAPQAALVLRYGEWIMAVKLFRLVEECRMYGQEPTPRDLSFHKIAVTALISTGEFLRWQMVGIPCEQLAASGLSIEAAEIHVRALDDSYAEWHLPVSKEREDNLKKSIFAADGNPSSTS